VERFSLDFIASTFSAYTVTGRAAIGACAERKGMLYLEHGNKKFEQAQKHLPVGWRGRWAMIKLETARMIDPIFPGSQ